MKDAIPDCIISGSGEKTIVFVHYFGGDAGSWQWLTKRLAKTHTCICLNLPGFNNTKPLDELSIYSFAHFINDKITELKITDYMLCGHSMGGKLIVYANQIMTGEKATKLILIAPSPPTTENMSASEKERMLKHPDIDEAIETVRGATNRKLKKEKSEYAINSQLRIDEATWRWWLMDGMNEDISEFIKFMDVPTFVICSKKDPVITEEAIFSEVIPNLNKPSLINFGKSGHLIPLEATRKLARQIKKISKNT